MTRARRALPVSLLQLRTAFKGVNHTPAHQLQLRYGTRFSSLSSPHPLTLQHNTQHARHDTRTRLLPVLAVYGDMGNTLHNNMKNLHTDCVVSRAVDAIVHLGDHCYDLSMGNGQDHHAPHSSSPRYRFALSPLSPSPSHHPPALRPSRRRIYECLSARNCTMPVAPCHRQS